MRRFFRALRLAWRLSRSKEPWPDGVTLATLHEDLRALERKVDGVMETLRTVERKEDGLAALVKQKK